MNKKELVELFFKQFESCGLNSFGALGKKEEKMWETPLVGFASGNDPLFQFLKEDIGGFYMTPQEVFRARYPNLDASAGSLTVVSFAFAQTAETKKEQAQQDEEPCLRWMMSRNTWKAVSAEIYALIGAALEECGIRFAIPDLMPEMQVAQSEKYGRSAVWSQRHTAMVCGLGTFGLSEGLITKRGVAVRFASLVIDMEIEPDKREYEQHQEWCLFHSVGGCGACMKRCPVGAITEDGHDKEKCAAYLNEINRRHFNDPLLDPKVEAGCGLCQSAVPCADGKPVIS